MAADLWSGGSEATLLLHGLPGSRLALRPLAERVAADRTVVVPDLLGFGESVAPPNGAPHAREQAMALLAWLDREPLDGCSRAVDLVGCDFGGPTALWLLHLAPGRFRSLTLVAANLFADTPVPPPLRALALPGLGALMARAMLSLPGLLGMWRGAVADRQALPWRRFWRSTGAASSRRASRELLRESLRRLTALYRPIEEMLPRIAVPTLVAWGDADPFFPASQPQRTAAAIPGARLLLLRGCGHFVPEERPAQLAIGMRELWQRAAG